MCFLLIALSSTALGNNDVSVGSLGREGHGDNNRDQGLMEMDVSSAGDGPALRIPESTRILKAMPSWRWHERN